jgi:hypothetical protein
MDLLSLTVALGRVGCNGELKRFVSEAPATSKDAFMRRRMLVNKKERPCENQV